MTDEKFDQWARDMANLGAGRQRAKTNRLLREQSDLLRAGQKSQSFSRNIVERDGSRGTIRCRATPDGKPQPFIRAVASQHWYRWDPDEGAYIWCSVSIPAEAPDSDWFNEDETLLRYEGGGGRWAARGLAPGTIVQRVIKDDAFMISKNGDFIVRRADAIPGKWQPEWQVPVKTLTVIRDPSEIDDDGRQGSP